MTISSVVETKTLAGKIITASTDNCQFDHFDFTKCVFKKTHDGMLAVIFPQEGFELPIQTLHNDFCPSGNAVFYNIHIRAVVDVSSGNKPATVYLHDSYSKMNHKLKTGNRGIKMVFTDEEWSVLEKRARLLGLVA